MLKKKERLQYVSQLKQSLTLYSSMVKHCFTNKDFCEKMSILEVSKNSALILCQNTSDFFKKNLLSAIQTAEDNVTQRCTNWIL